MTMRKFDIQRPNRDIERAVWAKIDNLNKPLGSLGRLEEIAAQVCLVQQTLSPTLRHPCHLLFGGDHGVEREGVSATPREVTRQQMENFAHGGGGVNVFCRQHGVELAVVDVGVDGNISHVDGVIDRKIACGTRNFLYEAAMTATEMDSAIGVGATLVEDCHARGCDILSIGEMGAANTSASSAWMSLLGGVPIGECVGAGSGLDTNGMERKTDVLRRSIERFKTEMPAPHTEDIIRWFGGFEMVAAVGAMLRAAELRMVVVVDGFIMTACALAATKISPAAQDYMIFAHVGDESGHARLLSLMGAKPLLSLGLRLGEGTGALCALPIIESAVRMVNEMGNFKDAHITKYF